MSTILIVASVVAVACAVGFILTALTLIRMYQHYVRNPLKGDDLAGLEVFFRRQFRLVLALGICRSVLFVSVIVQTFVAFASRSIAPVVVDQTAVATFLALVCTLASEAIMKGRLRVVAEQLRRPPGD